MEFQKISLSFDDVCSILADANYGISSVEFDRTSDRDWQKEDIKHFGGEVSDTLGICYEDKLTADLFCGGDIIVIDNNEDADNPEAVHHVTLRDFNIAAVKLANEYPEIMARFLDETTDINDTDVFLQLAVFNEVIYG